MSKHSLTIEGRNVVHDALLGNKRIETIYVSRRSKKDPKIQEILKLAQKERVTIKSVQPEQIHALSRTSNAQGIVAFLRAYEVSSLERILKERKDKALILLYNRLDYEQNLGAILRSSWGAGVDAVVVSPQGVHSVTPVVAKASMGGALHVPLIAQSLFQSLTLIKEYGIPIVGVDMKKGKSYTEITLLGPVAFLFGGEDSGISEPLAKYCDIFIHIPMLSKLSSLNVSVATALVIFEKRRQERQGQTLKIAQV